MKFKVRDLKDGEMVPSHTRTDSYVSLWEPYILALRVWSTKVFEFDSPKDAQRLRASIHNALSYQGADGIKRWEGWRVKSRVLKNKLYVTLVARPGDVKAVTGKS